MTSSLCRKYFRWPISVGTFLALIWFTPAIGTEPPTPEDEIGDRYYVFQHGKRSDDSTEPSLAPADDSRHISSSWMNEHSDGKGITYELVSDRPQSEPLCARWTARLSRYEWLGVCYLLDGQWEPEQGFNLYDEMTLSPADSIQCRFWARATLPVCVKFGVGGVTKGKIHDSLKFPVMTRPIKLTSEWKRYDIDVTGNDLKSLVTAFKWIASREDQERSIQDITFDLDTIYFVKIRSKPE